MPAGSHARSLMPLIPPSAPEREAGNPRKRSEAHAESRIPPGAELPAGGRRERPCGAAQDRVNLPLASGKSPAGIALSRGDASPSPAGDTGAAHRGWGTGKGGLPSYG